MEPKRGEHGSHVAAPSLWPVGFAIGVAILLLGTILGWVIAGLGAVITALFGFLWIRDATNDLRGEEVAIEPERREVATRASATAEPRPANEGEAGMPLPEEGEVERYPRSAFLGAATLGVGGVIGGLVTVPVLGFTILPAFTSQGSGQVDVGAVDDFEKEQWLITTFLQDPDQGEVSRRTAYIRNNGELDGQPSFTILSHRCVHLGCPVQPNGPVRDDEATRETRAENEITRIPADPSGFGCPCHGGQYDTEGNRKAGPPVRAMDRYEFSIRGGRLLLGQTYSVSEVRGQGAEARIKRHRLAKPGVHVDGPSSWLYPISPP